MKRILAGAAGIFTTQALLWPDHHVVAVVADVICIAAVASGGRSERKASDA
jgi:hypothetical protein